MKMRRDMKRVQELMARRGHNGESDRIIPTAKPRHLFSGKRDLGTHNRR